MIKVLLVVKDLHDRGGVNNAASCLAESMEATGEVEFHVLSHRIRDDMKWVKQQLPLPPQGRLPLVSDEGYMLKTRRTIAEAVREVKPDLVHVHTPVLLPPKDTPTLVSVHGTYLRELPYLWKYPLTPFYKLFQIAYTYNIYAVERFCLKYYDRYHVSCDRTREEIKSMGVSESSIFRVPYGVDTNRFKPGAPPAGLREKYGIPATARIILSLGAMVPRKGQDVVAAAARQVLDAHEDAEFVFAGPIARSGQQYIRMMRERAAKAGVPQEKLHFTGSLPQEDLTGFYNACAVFASGSYQEGFGLNVLEAASCGKPVVTTDVGGVREMLGGHGRIVPVNDPAALARGIIEALNEGREEIPGLRRHVEENFTWQKVGRDMVDVYRAMAALKNIK